MVCIQSWGRRGTTNVGTLRTVKGSKFAEMFAPGKSYPIDHLGSVECNVPGNLASRIIYYLKSNRTAIMAYTESALLKTFAEYCFVYELDKGLSAYDVLIGGVGGSFVRLVSN